MLISFFRCLLYYYHNIFFPSRWSARQIYYNGSGSTFIDSIASSPGSQLNLTTALLKTLGAQIRSGRIAIYILARSNENENYFYPTSIIVRAIESIDEWRNIVNNIFLYYRQVIMFSVMSHNSVLKVSHM